MGIKTKLLKILEVNTKQRDSARKAVKALVYNEITEGEYKGWFKIEQLVPPKGVLMSVWTKEQSADLDKRFGQVNTRLDSLESDVKVLKTDVKVLKTDIKEVKSNIGKILEMISSMNNKIDKLSQQK